MGARETSPMGIPEEELSSLARWGHLTHRGSILLVGASLGCRGATQPQRETSPRELMFPQDAFNWPLHHVQVSAILENCLSPGSALGEEAWALVTDTPGFESSLSVSQLCALRQAI